MSGFELLRNPTHAGALPPHPRSIGTKKKGAGA